jgi:hypothetical protein
VAGVISVASRDVSRKLRYPAGLDATAFCANRASVGDEVWREQSGLALERNNASIRQWWLQHFGLDVSAGFPDRAPRPQSKL